MIVSAEQADIIDRAIGWHLRLADADEAAWSAFVDWLEADPAHAAAYDRVAAGDRLIGGARFPAARPLPGNDDAPRRRWPWLAAGGAAAAVVAALTIPALTPAGSAYAVATGAGERRVVALDDGTSIEMSGGTRLRLDHADPRVATLERGEAVFHVRHDAAHPFVMTAGGTTIRDLGTVFNVASDGTALSVAVAEGAVEVGAAGGPVRLGAGDMLSRAREGGPAVKGRIAPDLVGGWRSGRLSFHDQRLAAVTATLDRLYGYRIALDGALPERPFTGMIRLSGTADRDIPHLAGLIGATWRRDQGRWILSDAQPSPR